MPKRSCKQFTNSRDENRTWHGHEIIDQDTRKLLIGRPLWKLQFTFREANVVAHTLAKLALPSRFGWKRSRVSISKCVMFDKSCND